MSRLCLRPTTPTHRATTRHLAALYPFQASAALRGRGTLIGITSHGATFAYDPFELYERGVLTGPAMVVLGRLGRGKSALVKSYLYRQIGIYGRRAIVISPRLGEYNRLAGILGVTPIRLAPGGSITLNPLDAPDTTNDALRLRALRGVCAACLDRPLRPAEDAALAAVLRRLLETAAEATLPRVVELLLDPPDTAWQLRWQSREHWLAESRDAALALDRLCIGDARGMYDAPTTPGISLDAPLVILDLSAVADSAAISILMTAALSWVHARIAAETDTAHTKRIVVVDEAWRVLPNLAAAEALVETVKHARAYGIQTITITHRIADLQAVGDEGTRLARIAEGLLSDAETKVVYAQPADQIALAADRLGLTSTEAAILPHLGRGQALWKIGTHSTLVTHQLTSHEHWICDTNARMIRQARADKEVRA